jgi:thiamine transport system permease protein
VFLGVFFLYPVASIIWLGLGSGGQESFGVVRETLTDPGLWRAVWFTTWQALASTALTLVVAAPAAYVFGRFEFPAKAWLRAAITVPFVMPTVVVGAAFLTLLGPDGPFGVDLERSIWAILIAHVFYNYAVVVRTVGGALEQIDPRLEDAARMLGADRFTALRRVTLPVVWPSVLAAASLVFLFTFTSFGVVLILGGLEYSTLEVVIWRATTQRLDLAFAAVVALVQMAFVATSLALLARAQQRRAVRSNIRIRTTRPAATRAERATIAAAVLGTIALLGVPLAVLVMRSLRTSAGLGLGNYAALFESSTRGLFVPPAESVGNSLLFALPATAIAVTIGLSAALFLSRSAPRVARLTDTLLMLPLGTSSVTVGFGILIALDWPVDLRANPIIIPIAHSLVAMPFVVRVATPALRSIRERLREAATMLGAPPAKVWQLIDLPIIARATAVGAGFALAVSLGEFGASAFIVRPDRPTLPVAIFRLLGQPGASIYGQAMALSVLLMLLTAASILTIDRWRTGDGSEF